MQMIHCMTPLDTTGLWRVTAAANMAGLSVPQLRALAARGAIPVQIIEGDRVSYVRARELVAWLNSRTPAVADKQCTDLF